MILNHALNFAQNEAQEIVIENVLELPLVAKNGSIVYLSETNKEGFYIRRKKVWNYLCEFNELPKGAIRMTLDSGIQYLSVRVDRATIYIDGNNDLAIKPNSIGNNHLDNQNIRLNDFATPDKNISMGSFRITSLGDPVNPADAVNKEYVDAKIFYQVASTGGDFQGDWSGPGFPAVGSSPNGSVLKGDWWRITSMITIGDYELESGDAFFAKTDFPGLSSSNWFALQTNTGQATSTGLGLVRVSTPTDLTADAGENTERVVRIADLLLRTATFKRAGMIQLATQAEVIAGSNASKAVTPATLAVYLNGLMPKGQTPKDQSFTYSSSNVFSLSFPDPTPIYVALNGQILREGELFDWTISGTNLTITAPLEAGNEISILYYIDLPFVMNYGRNIDGGNANSIYLPIQHVDGGGA